jgi:hypothetical protein
MGQRRYKRHQAKPDQKRDKLALKQLKAEGMPQAAIQRFADGAQTPEDILVLQKTLGNEAVANLLSQGDRAPGLESGPPPTVQRQDPMEYEEEPIAAVPKPDKEEESGGLWGGLKKAWGWFKENVLGGGKSKTDQTPTPESGTPPDYTPQEGIEEYYEESGEWTEEIM